MSRFASKGRYLGLALLFPLFPLLLGGKGAPVAPNKPPTVSESSDSVAYWLFLMPDAWEAAQVPGGLESIPGRLRSRSQWLQALSVDVPQNRVHELAGVQGVYRIRPVQTLMRMPSPSGERTAQGSGDAFSSDSLRADSVYGDLEPVLRVLEVPSAHALGFFGTGTRVGILDGYFLPSHPFLRGVAPLAVRDFVEGDGAVEPGGDVPANAASHGTALWSLISADFPGVLTGAATGTGILLARVLSEADDIQADEDRWVAGLEWLETQGARVVLSGVGFRNFEDGEYTQEDLNGDVAPATLAADQAARRGILVIAPVGNGGPDPGTLQSPADGDSVLAVGAVSGSGSPAAFSANGPTADGRSKPDLFAPGEGVPAASIQTGGVLDQFQGTEIAGALVAGAAALFIEAHPERGPMGILQALQNSAAPHSGGVPGVPRVAPAILFPDGVWPLPPQDVGGDGRVTSLAPQFQWNVPTTHPLGLPVSFRLDFAEDSLFQDIILQDSVVGTFARRLQLPLPPRTRLFWRVVARSTQGIGWATPPQGPMEVPSWVGLDVLNDPGGTQVADPQPEFLWTAVDLPGPGGPLTFDLQILLDREEEIVQSYPGLTGERHVIEESLPFNLPLRWRVIAKARSGQADTVTSAGPFVVTGGENPPITILYQNFPNPFPNPDSGISDTRIWFDLANRSTVELTVFDMRGRLVRDLIPGRGCAPVELEPGLYGREEGPPQDPCAAFTWDGTRNSGEAVPPGVYLLRLQAGGVVEVRRVVYWP